MTRCVLALIVAALPFSHLAAQAPNQQQALATVKKLGAAVIRDEQARGRPVVSVIFMSQKPVTDADLKSLTGFPKLKTLALGGSDKVTDKGLEAVAGLKNLEDLSLTGLKGITNDGMKAVGKLPNLKRLDLSLTGIGDAGLKHLYGLKKLESLSLTLTNVSEEGVKGLKMALPKVTVNR